MKRIIRRAAVATASAVAVAVVLAGCSGAATNTSARDDTIVVGTSLVPSTLDPVQASEAQTDTTVGAMYDKLVDYDAEGELVPLLATDWTYNDDATVVTITLRDDVVFHSGNPLTAADVVYTLDRATRLGTGVASFLSSYQSAKAIDDTQVEITLNGTNTTFVGALSKLYVLDSALVAENEGTDDGQAWLAAHDAGSGVYTLAGYTPNQNTKFERFDDSWRFDEDRPEQLTYRYIMESATMRDELKSGGIDVAAILNATDLSTVRSTAGLAVQDLPSPLQLFVMMNTASGITTDPRVREAIQLAYDYDGHISSILLGDGTVASGLASPTVGCRVDNGKSEQDVERAKELLEDAGVVGETLTLAYQSTIPEHQKAATLLQSNLKDVGLDLELVTVTYPEYASMITSPETVPDLGLVWDFPYYPEIGPMLHRVYDSQFIGQTNYALYSNPAVDDLLRAGVQNADAEAACDLFTQAQELILADRVSVNISNPFTSIAVSDAIAEIDYTPTYQLLDPSKLKFAR